LIHLIIAVNCKIIIPQKIYAGKIASCKSTDSPKLQKEKGTFNEVDKNSHAPNPNGGRRSEGGIEKDAWPSWLRSNYFRIKFISSRELTFADFVSLFPPPLRLRAKRQNLHKKFLRDATKLNIVIQCNLWQSFAVSFPEMRDCLAAREKLYDEFLIKKCLCRISD
jgi:hypothetical protein